jgi:hypothetical protein
MSITISGNGTIDGLAPGGLPDKSVLKEDLEDGIFSLPIGCIIMWYGTIDNIPEGWHWCDGTNGTPDLRSRFPRGASSTTTGTPSATGGSDDAIVVEHTHSVTGSTNQEPNHQHAFTTGPQFSGPFGGVGSGISTHNLQNFATNLTVGAGAHSHTINVTASTVGTSGTGANLPRYAEVHFIMRVL